MKVVKVLFTFSLPIILLYLINIAIFDKYPIFFPCFCGSGLYIQSLDRTNSFNKLMDNFLNKEKNDLSTQDYVNLVLIFILTFLFTWLIYILGKHDELGYPFGLTSVIFVIISHLKIPKRFFS